jgi:predicted deacetylase
MSNLKNRLKSKLTMQQVLANLDARFNVVLNEDRHQLPRVPHKHSQATIKREEFECLQKEIANLRFEMEENLMEERFMEVLHGSKYD